MLETPGRIEPALFEDAIPASLAGLSVDIQRDASPLGARLHPDSAAELADMVRMMNSYYSNLIEGHNSRPKDIELALARAQVDEERRPLAEEARAHVLVQREIDDAYRRGRLAGPTSVAFIQNVHRRFYAEMPAELRHIERRDGGRRPIVPGEFRQQTTDDVVVGRHPPPSSERVSAFMDYFETRYAPAEKRGESRIIAIASAHHRFNFIHPFPDGNGRVSRLMSHAMAQRAGIGGHGLWSISRGLARGLKDRGEYKRMMDHADSPRQGDLDGRGNLSAKALKEFSEWFMLVMLDQIRFSTFMFDLERLDDRYRMLVADLVGDRRAPELVGVVLRNGAMERGDAGYALRTSERTARNTLSELTALGFLKSDTPKGAVRIAFPLDYRERLFPNLFFDIDVSPPEPPAAADYRR